MYDPDTHSVKTTNLLTLTLATPVPEGRSVPSDYDELINKPTINGVELSGDLSLEDIGIPDFSEVPTESLSDDELDDIISAADRLIDNSKHN